MQLNINIEALSRTAFVWLLIGGLGVYAGLQDVSQRGRASKERATSIAGFGDRSDRVSKSGRFIGGGGKASLDAMDDCFDAKLREHPGISKDAEFKLSEECRAAQAAESTAQFHSKYKADQAAKASAELSVAANTPGLVVMDSVGMGPNMALIGRTPMVTEVVAGSLADKAGLRKAKEGTTAIWWLEAVNGKPTPNKAAVAEAFATDGPLSVTIWKENVRQIITLRPAPGAAPASSSAASAASAG